MLNSNSVRTFRIMSAGIVEGLTLHDIVTTPASWGGAAQYAVSLKSCSVRTALKVITEEDIKICLNEIFSQCFFKTLT